MNELYSPLRLSAAMMSFFGILALVLATVGVYGVIAYSVSQRTHEIGVRMALGAHRTSVVALVMRQGTTLAVAGLGLGLPAAWALSSVAASRLFGVMVVDPRFLVAITVGLATVALLASYLPARSASRLDPMAALRSE
jgi:putative ABC transport system permease protein